MLLPGASDRGVDGITKAGRSPLKRDYREQFRSSCDSGAIALKTSRALTRVEATLPRTALAGAPETGVSRCRLRAPPRTPGSERRMAAPANRAVICHLHTRYSTRRARDLGSSEQRRFVPPSRVLATGVVERGAFLRNDASRSRIPLVDLSSTRLEKRP